MNKVIRLAVGMFVGILLCGCAEAEEKVRVREDFNDGWRFHLGDVPEAYAAGYDDSGLHRRELPYDWAVEDYLNIENPAGAC